MKIVQNLNIKKLLIFIVVTIVIGSFFAFFLMDDMKAYDSMDKPALSPPPIVFPIAWSILYILMAISLYIVSESKESKEEKNKIYIVYSSQLILNSLWTLIFFGLKQRLLAFIWILALLVSVIYMTVLMYRVSKKAGLLQIPYILWLAFASYLNFAIYLMYA